VITLAFQKEQATVLDAPIHFVPYDFDANFGPAQNFMSWNLEQGFYSVIYSKKAWRCRQAFFCFCILPTRFTILAFFDKFYIQQH